MIERITFSIGSNDVEQITGEQLHIINELMKSDEQRLGAQMILKADGADRTLLARSTGASAITASITALGDNSTAEETEDAVAGAASSMYSVAVSGGGGSVKLYDRAGVDLSTANGDTIVALEEEGLEKADFTSTRTAGTDLIKANNKAHGKTRLMYFAAQGVNGQKPIKCAKKRLTIPLGLFFTKHPSQYFPLAAIAGCNDVRIQIRFKNAADLCRIRSNMTGAANAEFTQASIKQLSLVQASTKLRCHYVHVTGPEATTLMNKEHVRLLKLFAHNQHIPTNVTKIDGTIPIDLSFLHPVSTLLITVRNNDEVTGASTHASSKGFFQYHGMGRAPAGSKDDEFCRVKSIKLNINGQERHPSLAAQGIERDYLMNRVMPLMHSNCSSTFEDCGLPLKPADISSVNPSKDLGIFKTQLSEMLDRKEIYVFPFALNPEGANPSGAVNFSKVSHARLEIQLDSRGNSSPGFTPRIDVYALYYNWLQIKDGRALLSFA